MIVFVRYNLGPGVAVEIQREESVMKLKEVVANQQGVEPEQLRVLFAGRELHSSASLQGCDLPEQSTIHVVRPPSGPAPSGSSPSGPAPLESSPSRLLLLQERLAPPRGRSLAHLDFSWSRLQNSCSGLAVVLEAGGGPDEEEPQAGGVAEAGGGAVVLEGGGGAEEEEAEPPAAAPQGPSSCSSFFIFCKSCSSIQPGKLRVRCRSCRETVLTLSRGPSCWDDVLLPGRIDGVCQSGGCPGNQAEFYWKCASHPTSDDDVSVALDLIMRNQRRVSCIACTDVLDLVLVFQCSDRHVICLDCFLRYCQTRLDERQFLHHPEIGYSLPCAAGCQDSLIREIHHFRILGDDQYGRYQRYGAEECLLTIGGLMCPSPGCGAGLLPPDGSRRVECDPRLGCGFLFCRTCRGRYHEGACPALEAPPTPEGAQGFQVGQEASQRGRWDQNQNQDQESLLLIQESTKRCPECSVPVERNGGCMHMCCPRCRTEWCWICRIPWNRDCMGNHWFG
ncbi:E3 ubiquitin-protein ligase parkin isoform X1 [Cololabis saira]|uniref:E3 ubiquitin-protein ligase parkin isoform X1 n=1 Tax=Cololabis saira TaxID=129043 RepID=UPI002AD34682|nr:E3 ubiquitin-protein ligase parkin isoform X1 [Cololabis saira]